MLRKECRRAVNGVAAIRHSEGARRLPGKECHHHTFPAPYIIRFGTFHERSHAERLSERSIKQLIIVGPRHRGRGERMRNLDNYDAITYSAAMRISHEHVDCREGRDRFEEGK